MTSNERSRQLDAFHARFLGVCLGTSMTLAEVDEEVLSKGEYGGDCDSPYPFEDYDMEHGMYLQRLAFLHSDHMYLYDHGCFANEDFLPETVEDVYNKNLYTMSWFYDGCYPFDSWEANYDNFLSQQAYAKLNDDEFYAFSAQYST